MRKLTVILNNLAMITAGIVLSAGAYANTRPVSPFKTPERTRSVTVKYSDLDLARTAGVDTLYKRIRAAGDRICGPVYGLDTVTPMQDRQNWESCYKHALDNAAAKVGNQQLSQLIYKKTGGMTTVAERD